MLKSAPVEQETKFRTKQKFNCFGFAFYTFGLQKEDKWIDRPSYQSLMEKFFIVTEEEADVIGLTTKIKSSKEPLLEHLAIIDKSDRKFVIDREMCDAPVRRVTKEKMLEWFINHPTHIFTVVYLKLKKDLINSPSPSA
ncbi:MAG: hypothetical protein A3E12_02270 [Candidatus Levybacteria bacterium RIFCSPHIGHO2_12_FULL_39_9]|nr:MAG: hypothetical protein A2800_00345 [Candidatus Levybacteria bacterium RIFCSPHIGHO2_01_FULL_40_16]OGH27925.1 MAG: hypothetical protein A3E12_02270 [Candidatus Levybacteria bacterium RIFCSPHIGHO2_12_FULL_39_9]